MRGMFTATPARPKGDVKSLGPLLHYLKPYRWAIALATVAMVFTSASVLGLGAALRFMVDEGLGKGNAHLLDLGFLALCAVTLLLALATYTRYFLVSWLGERVVADIRKDVFARLLGMHISFFETTRTGELLSRLTTDTTLLQTMIGSSLSVAARNVLLFIGGFALLLITSPRLTSYVFVMVPVVVFPIIVLGRRVRGWARESQERVADINAHAEESINAIRTLQSFTLEPYTNTRFSGHVESALSTALKRIRTRAALTALVITLVFGSVVAVLWLGGKDVLSGAITAGQLSAFVFYSVVVAGAVGAISEVMTDLQRAAGAAERLNELLSMSSDITSGAHAAALPASAEVVFDHVGFAYPTRGEISAVVDFSLKVEAGKRIALVGHSGAGKTTIFQLLLRFYDPQAGSIRIGGVDIRELPLATLRGLIGLVPQDPVIFSGSARENIRLGNVDASEEDIIRAAKMAAAWDFISALPQGLDTHVGEKGVQLSGGQRQRIAIARAVLRDPKLLLLDEATSALDSENEFQVQQAFDQVMKGRTTFVIAHRLSTITKADSIILMNAGRIDAVGTHDELLVRSPLYKRLAELQFKAAA